MKNTHILLSGLLLINSTMAVAAGNHADAGHDDSNASKHEHSDKLSSVGKPAKYNENFKTIQVITDDNMRYKFTPALTTIKSGEKINFVVKNIGKLPHEFSIGNQLEQKKHNKMMQQMPKMKHEDGNTISLKPDEEKTLSWHFSGSEEVVFACNVLGHYEAGMFHKVALTQ